MADPVYFNVDDAAERVELARAIGRHGLSAGLVHCNARWHVEISTPRENPRTFLADLGMAFAAWNGGVRVGTQIEVRD